MKDYLKESFECQNKDQLISKCLFGVFNFLQNTNKNMLHCSKNKFICSFFGRIHGLKIFFLNWLTFSRAVGTGGHEPGLIPPSPDTFFTPSDLLLLDLNSNSSKGGLMSESFSLWLKSPLLVDSAQDSGLPPFFED